MSNHLHESLRDNVRILGDSLGRTIADDLGDGFVGRIETIPVLVVLTRSFWRS